MQQIQEKYNKYLEGKDIDRIYDEIHTFFQELSRPELFVIIQELKMNNKRNHLQ